ncbi:hypothetical protein JRO89_XS07G0225800 [Xanthoceras sorbifolium]|uniref:Myb-like domain-containing protein n=1 Tax=Xanthoceras sorbifolium TaxID=99658 RepID=A0ABQ8HUN0_9ROSI|nr:hypothetical protein JRO89_XS07G0225800 [Xanthoceras sorbifolium]
MLGDSGLSGDVAATSIAAREAHEAPGNEAAMTAAASNSGEEDKSRVFEESDRGFGGNRWPRQETLALLKIRSDMDVAFRDASAKGPLWDEVSRKLAELGFHRSAKKCKEKFENVYKYHRRTKEGRTSKGPGKTYRFFDQLEAFEHHPSLPSPSSTPCLPPQKIQAPPPVAAAVVSMPVANPPNVSHNMSTGTTVPSTALVQPISITIPSFPTTNPTILAPSSQVSNPMNPSHSNIPSSFRNISTDLLSNSTSSSTSSDLELGGKRKRKRKWRDFFERLMQEVIEKQEELQKKFLEAIEKREHERMVREEAWRMQEMTRINREREILAQERSIASAKDAAVMAFLQKISEQQNPAAPLPLPIQQVVNLGTLKTDNGDRNNFMPTSSSRWPKVEVEALINLRTHLDSKYQENGPKGPLWEEISSGMRKLGYNRNSKRCKEKWENINKYFKKVKESNKRRPEDSKTCPYFHQLDALYKERNKFDHSSSIQLNPENSVPLMVRPEQQWPPQPEHRQDSAMEDMDSDQNLDEDDKDGDDDEDDEGGGFEIVPNKQVSLDTNE